MFCPRCKTEYRPGFARCSDCDVDLVRSFAESTTLPHDYSQAWQEYRKIRNRVLIIVFGYFPVPLLLIIFMPASTLLNNGPNYIFGFVNLLWLGLLVTAILRLRNWHCPRCGEKFGFRLGTNQCVNCALPKYSD